MVKDRLQNYLIFYFQNTQSFKGFWKQFRSSYFVTIPKLEADKMEYRIEENDIIQTLGVIISEFGIV